MITRTHTAMAAAAAAAILSLAACDHATPVHTAAAKPKTCTQQYAALVRGPGGKVLREINKSLSQLRGDSASDDIPATLADARAMGTEAREAGKYPVPRCADPAGYWPRALAEMRAMGDDAGMRGSAETELETATGPIGRMVRLIKRFSAELDQTAPPY